MEEWVKSIFGLNVRLGELFLVINNVNLILIGKIDNLDKYNVLI